MTALKIAWSLLLILIFVGTIAQNQSTFKLYEQAIPGSKLKFKMAPIAAGNFLLGSSSKETIRKPDEVPQRKVSISAFWIGVHEVTHDLFDLFFTDETVSRNSTVDAVTRPTPQYIDLSWGMGKDGGFPANSMSQHTALMYCYWLFKKTGIFYRLPTEAEWEYACRAGTTSLFPFGNNIKDLNNYAWYSGNSNNKYHKVGQKKANAWGLYDMLGNVSEWTLDQYDEKYYSKINNGTKDPSNPPTSRYPKTLKGGGFSEPSGSLRCACRLKSESSWNKRDPQVPKSTWWLTDAASIGFRIVRPLKQPTADEVKSFFEKYLSQ